MIGYKALLILGDGMVLGMVAVGIYVAFQWLRFPDLTPDGSFVLGASVFAKLVHAGVAPTTATLAAGLAGGIAGCGTAVINGYARVPTVVSGLLVASALHSIVWLLLGKPNLFIEPEMTLVGPNRGAVGAAILVAWLGAIWLALVIALSVFGQTVSGLRLRAIGENPILARDLGVSQTVYRMVGLALANGVVAVAGGLHAQRSFAADLNMGIGITVIGLGSMVLGLMFVSRRGRLPVVLGGLLGGAVLHRAVTFGALELGLPAESYRLVSAILLLVVFTVAIGAERNILKDLKWS